MPALQPKVRDPFLLPVCDCGGPMNLAKSGAASNANRARAEDLRVPVVRRAAGLHRGEAGGGTRLIQIGLRTGRLSS